MAIPRFGTAQLSQEVRIKLIEMALPITNPVRLRLPPPKKKKSLHRVVFVLVVCVVVVFVVVFPKLYIFG